MPLKPDDPYYADFASLARTVEAVLRTARQFGAVGIITLAKRPWIHQISSGFLPGLDLPKLLLELGIPIFYAREVVGESVMRMGTQAAFVRAKRDAMRKCFRQLFGPTTGAKNVVSIGDAEIERLAVEQMASGMATSTTSGRGPFCKTVRLLVQPSITQLQKQLEVLTNCLGAVMQHQGSLSLETASMVADQGLDDSTETPELPPTP